MLTNKIQKAYYFEPIKQFLIEETDQILGKICREHSHDLNDLQKNAWLVQIDILKKTFPKLSENLPIGFVGFEFSIPRVGKRVDNVVIINNILYVIEFKTNTNTHNKNDIDQVLDYSMDLKNFHEGSNAIEIVPILVATNANNVINNFQYIREDIKVYKVIKANDKNLVDILKKPLSISNSKPIDPKSWYNSLYKPTPTIVEAARALYNGHNVKEISRSDAGAINLSQTTDCLSAIIDETKKNKEKAVCFVTGVPGSGKTLAGLNIATESMRLDSNENAVFLSGNGPLVSVLREALARDQQDNEKVNPAPKTSLINARREASAFIQNVHHFRDEGLKSNKPPPEKVVIFDEAQRAWTKDKTATFMKRKKGMENFGKSEPGFLLEIMNRHNDWCVVICLIGGGQEINTGEAGIDEWVGALSANFKKWKIYYSNLIVEDKNYLKTKDTLQFTKGTGTPKAALHLSTSIRSFRSDKLSDFVEQLLALEVVNARKTFESLSTDYPIKITRNLDEAKDYIKSQANGTERYGLVASSKARRLRPYGVNVKNRLEPSNWFLNGKDDVRSSFFLEEVATEFDIQGLELDWSIVAWGGDLYLNKGVWNYQSFVGHKWQNIAQEIKQNYLINAYRVLLTRARQGVVIFLPNGSDEDETRRHLYYDETYDYLTSLGIKEL